MEEIFEEVKASDEFKKISSNSRLSHIFMMLPQDFNPLINSVKDYEIQFGFFNPEDKKVAILKYNKGLIDFIPGEDPYTKESVEIEGIDLKDLSIDIKKSFEILGDLIKKEYKGNIPLKTIVVLQKIEDNFVWNITILRSDFKTLNVRIDATNGDVISHKLAGLIESS